jgi:hypothetical protein
MHLELAGAIAGSARNDVMRLCGAKVGDGEALAYAHRAAVDLELHVGYIARDFDRADLGTGEGEEQRCTRSECKQSGSANDDR